MPSDRDLIQIVDAAMAEAVRKSGHWIACRPGCCECCIAPFAITPLDAIRLRRGLAELERSDPKRAGRVRRRAQLSVERLRAEFPDDPLRAAISIDEAAADEPCPALDPETKTCDLYSARPVTCRTFGPAVRFAEGLAVCELCYQGASGEEIVACQVEVDPDNLEAELLKELAGEDTIVAFALYGVPPEA